jgi:hypothetical protein
VAEVGAALKPLGDAFVKLIELIAAPVVFLTVARWERAGSRPIVAGVERGSQRRAP